MNNGEIHDTKSGKDLLLRMRKRSRNNIHHEKGYVWQMKIRVRGKNVHGKDVAFFLSEQELKIVRKALANMTYFHPEDRLAETVQTKFRLFGNSDHRGSLKPKNTREAVFAKLGRRCAIEGCQKKELTIDHINPLMNGGNNYIDNLQILCRYHHEIKNTNWLLQQKKQEIVALEIKIKKQLEEQP